MKSLLSLLIILLIATVNNCVLPQDSLKVKILNNPPLPINQSIKIDSTYPPVRCSTFKDGKKSALRDISNNRVRIQMTDKKWCTWHDHFSDSVEEKYNIRVIWEYEQKSSYYFDEGYCRNSGYSDGYFTTMDSVLSQKVSNSKLSEFIKKLKNSYGTSENSCPDIDDGFIEFDKFAEPDFNEEELNKVLTKKAAEIDSSIAGRIIIQLTIFKDGTILKAQMLRGIHDKIDQMVSNAFLDLRFSPCLKEGKPVSCKRAHIVKIINE